MTASLRACLDIHLTSTEPLRSANTSAGQTIQKNLAEGMHVSTFVILNARTQEQLGREATVTFFVDHGSGVVCGHDGTPEVQPALGGDITGEP